MSSFEWAIICTFEFLTLKSSYDFWPFRALYLGPILSNHSDFGVFRLSSSSSFKWQIFWSYSWFLTILIIVIFDHFEPYHFEPHMILVSFDSALRAESNDTKIMWGSKWYGLEMVKKYNDQNGQKSWIWPKCMSFERARRAESNGTKISVIEQDWIKLWSFVLATYLSHLPIA